MERDLFFDDSTLENERLRLWKLYHQYRNPMEHPYRIMIVRNIIKLHGGWNALPVLTQNQKEIMYLYYERNCDDDGIGFRLGIGEYNARRERLKALSHLENVAQLRAVSREKVVRPRSSEQPRVLARRRAASPSQSPSLSNWDVIDNEAHYGRKEALIAKHLKEFNFTTVAALSEHELMVLMQCYGSRISIFEVALRSGLSEHKVREIKKSGLAKLREHEVAQGAATRNSDASVSKIRKRRTARARSNGAPRKGRKGPLQTPRLYRNTSCKTDRDLITQEWLANRESKQLQDRMALAWMPLIHITIKRKVKMDPGRFQYEDYVSIGLIGLASAIKNYDSTKGASFKTFAINGIQQAFRNLIPQELHKQNTFNRVYGALAELREIKKAEESGEADDEMMRKKDILQQRIEHINNLIGPRSLQQPIRYRNGNEVCLQDVVRDECRFEGEIEQSMLSRTMDEALLKVLHSNREYDVIRMRFYDGMTLNEVGKVIGVTRERVRQIEAVALRRLRLELGNRRDWLPYM